MAQAGEKESFLFAEHARISRTFLIKERVLVMGQNPIPIIKKGIKNMIIISKNFRYFVW
jgi:hypothetical protein